MQSIVEVSLSVHVCCLRLFQQPQSAARQQHSYIIQNPLYHTQPYLTQYASLQHSLTGCHQDSPARVTMQHISIKVGLHSSLLFLVQVGNSKAHTMMTIWPDLTHQGQTQNITSKSAKSHMDCMWHIASQGLQHPMLVGVIFPNK